MKIDNIIKNIDSDNYTNLTYNNVMKKVIN